MELRSWLTIGMPVDDRPVELRLIWPLLEVWVPRRPPASRPLSSPVPDETAPPRRLVRLEPERSWLRIGRSAVGRVEGVWARVWIWAGVRVPPPGGSAGMEPAGGRGRDC